MINNNETAARIEQLESRISNSLFPNPLDIVELQNLISYTEIIISGIIKYQETREYCEIDDFFYTPGVVTAEEILLFIKSILEPEGFIFTRSYPQQVAGENRIVVEYRLYPPSAGSRVISPWQSEVERALIECIDNLQQPHSGFYYRKKYGRTKKGTARPTKQEVLNA